MSEGELVKQFILHSEMPHQINFCNNRTVEGRNMKIELKLSHKQILGQDMLQRLSTSLFNASCFYKLPNFILVY